METIENHNAEVKNLNIGKTTNLVVREATQEVFDGLLELENMQHFSDILYQNIIADLINASFMTEQLELTEKQKHRLKTSINTIINQSKNQYSANINQDQRTKNIASLVKSNLEKIVEQMLSSLAKEVNRGALINSVAVSADCKSDKYNKIELHHNKSAGDITIPTNCLLISTNCLDLIKNSIEVVKKNKDENYGYSPDGLIEDDGLIEIK